MEHLLTRKQTEEATGKSRATIARYVKLGKVSVAKKNDQGHNLFDPSELIRAFGKINKPASSDTMPQKDTMTQVNQSLMQAEINQLKQRLEDKDERIEELKDQRSSWQKQAESSQRLLESSKKQKKGWFW